MIAKLGTLFESMAIDQFKALSFSFFFFNFFYLLNFLIQIFRLDGVFLILIQKLT